MAKAEMRTYTADELTRWDSGRLITLVLTLQRRLKAVEGEAAVLQQRAGASVVRQIDQCPTCNRTGAPLVNGGRARRCNTCRTVWSV